MEERSIPVFLDITLERINWVKDPKELLLRLATLIPNATLIIDKVTINGRWPR